MKEEEPLYESQTDLVGEFFLVNNMVVQLVNRARTASNSFSPLEKTRATFREMFTSTVGEDDLSGGYYDDIKNINNYKVLVYYYQFANIKRFIALDNMGLYVMRVSIHCHPQDISTADVFVGVLLNSIIFK